MITVVFLWPLVFLQCLIPSLAGINHSADVGECSLTESEILMQFRVMSDRYTEECEESKNFLIDMVKVNEGSSKFGVSLNSVKKEVMSAFIQIAGEEAAYFTNTSSKIVTSSCDVVNDTLVIMNFDQEEHAFTNKFLKEVWIKYLVLMKSHCYYSGLAKLEVKEKETEVYSTNDVISKPSKRSKRQVTSEDGEAYLLIVNGQQIYQYSLDGQRSSVLTSTTENAVALTYDLRRQFVFWSESGIIRRANLDGSGVITITSGLLNVVDGLAADWVTGSLYFTDVNFNIIGVIDRFFWFKILFRLDTNSNVRAIVVDPMNRMMYWTDWGTVASIERATMNGNDREILHNTSLVWPNALTIDYESQTLYWADASLDVLESSNVDGTNRRTLTTTGIVHPFAMTLYQSILYITDWGGNQLKNYFLRSQGSVNVLASLASCNRIFGIEVVSSELQKSVSNPCENNNGGCSHLCLLSTDEEGYSCSCPEGLGLLNKFTCAGGTPSIILSPEMPGSCKMAGHTTCCDSTVNSCEGSNSNCYCDANCHLYNDCCQDVSTRCRTQDKSPYFVLAEGRNIYVMDTKNLTRTRIIASNLNNSLSVDYNLKKKMLYWTDTGYPSLWRSYLDGNSPIPVLVNETIGVIAIDWITDKVYWTDFVQSTINVMDFKSGYRRMLFNTTPYIPEYIFVDPNARELYWADRDDAISHGRLIKASMDGNGFSVLLNTQGFISFTISYDSNLIYWASGGQLGSIGRDGSGLKNSANFLSFFPLSLAEVDNMTILYTSIAYDTALVTDGISVANGSISGCGRLNIVKVIGTNRQLVGNNPCGENNGGCSNLCLLSSVNSSGYTCACHSPDAVSTIIDNCPDDEATQPLPEHGKCKDAGIDGCCYNQLGCQGLPNTCRCDVSCRRFKDCCSDATTHECFTQDRSRVVIKVSPQFGNMLGGVGVYVEVSDDLLDSDPFICTFGNEDVVGKKLNSSFGVCISPLLLETGYIPLHVTIDDVTRSFPFLSMSPENAHVVMFSGMNDVLLTGDDKVTITWSPEALVPSTLQRDVTVAITPMFQSYRDGNFRIFPYQFPTFSPNDGEEIITLQDYDTFICQSGIGGINFHVCPMLFEVSIIRDQYLSGISIWTGTAYYKVSSVSDEEAVSDCEKWKDNAQNIKPLLERLQPCPPTLLLAVFDLTYEVEDLVSYLTRDNNYHTLFMDLFHPGVEVCYRQSIPTSRGEGQQCCYDTRGTLVKQPFGGSADSMSPIVNYNRHVMDDLVPYILCCKGSNISRCEDYYDGRPVGSENGYLLLIPACVYGDPHIVTLDGHKYTFNGKGEFTLIQTDSEAFALQGRMEQVVDNEGLPAPGTVFTAIVAKQLQSNTSVQFEVTPNTGLLSVLLNGEYVTFGEIALLQYDDVVLQDKGNETVQALFSGGANVEVTVSNGIISVMLVALPESMKRKTRGLMGPYNGIISDDLIPKDGGSPLPLDDTLENIHYKFGITWIISNESESLFTYRPGESWATYYFPDFIPMFGPTFTNASLENEAKEMCGGDQFCLFDVAATRRVEIGEATKQGQEMLNTIMEMSKPIICSPVCENGVCLENNTCSCNIGYRGDRCTDPVIEQCDFNPCKNNGNCTKQVLTVSCTCPPEYTGTFCQRKVPPFQVQFINSSPRVVGNDIFIEFLSTKSASSRCIFDGDIQQCSDGIVRYKGVNSGTHNFTIISTSSSGEIFEMERQIVVGPCGVNLINNGVTINDRNVTIEFTSTTRSLLLFHCKLRETGISKYCRSPLRYYNLKPGPHHVDLEPIRCSGGRIRRLRVEFDI